MPCTFVFLMRADLQCKRFGPHFFHLVMNYRGDCAAAAARFLSSPRLHLFCVPRLTASCFCPFLLFTKRRKPQRGKEGKGCWSLKVFCAPADARRRKLCIARFHAGVKTDSRRCVSFPPHKRCAGLRGGVGEVWHGRVSGCSTRQSRTIQKIFSLFPVPPHAMKPAVTPPSCTNCQSKRLSVRKGT